MKRILLVLLALILCLSLFSGCGGDVSWSHSYNGQRMPAGLFLFYQLLAVDEASTLAASGGASFANLNALLRLSVQGQPVTDFVNNTANQLVRQYYATQDRFEQMGLQFTAEMQALADATAESLWSQISHLLEPNHISRSSIQLHAVNQIKSRYIFDALYGEGGEHEVSLEELQREFVQEYAYTEIYLTGIPGEVPEGSEMSIEEFAAAIKREFEGAIPQLDRGEEFAGVMLEFDRWLAEFYGEDPDVVEPYDPSGFFFFIDKSEREQYLEELMDGIYAAPVGRAVIIEIEDYAWFIVRRIDVLGEEGLFDSYRDTILRDLKLEEFSAEMTAYAEEIAPEENRSAINRYKPARLTVNFS